MHKTSLFALSCALLFAVQALTQERPGRPAIDVPIERGVYYGGTAGMVPLPGQLFMPMHDRMFRDMLGIGSPGLRAVVPGAHAAVAIADKRPTFYLRGDRPGNRVYLMRGARKADYREFRFSRGRDIADWMRFRNKDLTALEVEPLEPGLVALRPHADLAPGEYVLITVLEPRFNAIRLAFDFGIAAASP